MNTMPHEIILENLHLDVNDYHSILEIYYFLGGSKDAFAVIEGRVSAKLPDKGYFFIRLDVSFEIADKLLYIYRQFGAVPVRHDCNLKHESHLFCIK